MQIAHANAQSDSHPTMLHFRMAPVITFLPPDHFFMSAGENSRALYPNCRHIPPGGLASYQASEQGSKPAIACDRQLLIVTVRRQDDERERNGILQLLRKRLLHPTLQRYAVSELIRCIGDCLLLVSWGKERSRRTV